MEENELYDRYWLPRVAEERDWILWMRLQTKAHAKRERRRERNNQLVIKGGFNGLEKSANGRA